jgi:predicted nucleotidyltransferase
VAPNAGFSQNEVMRLHADLIQVIKDVAQQQLGPDVEVRLFGSRLDDQARGGDIDLYIETPHVLHNRALTAARVAARLERRLGDRKVDVVLVDPSTAHQPVHTVARSEGVVL